jgi:hypothetical protein
MSRDRDEKSQAGGTAWDPGVDQLEGSTTDYEAPEPDSWQAMFADAVAWLFTVGIMLRDRLLRPLGKYGAAHYRKLRQSMRQRMLDRLVEHDSYDGGRAKDWQRFHRGKTSSSYLEDVKDPTRRK